MIVAINEKNASKVYPFFVSLHAMIPYAFLCPLSSFTSSLLHDVSEGEEMFKELFTYAIMHGDKVKGLIQYGIPNYEIKYDGERLYPAHVGVIRQLYFGMMEMSEMLTLVKRSLHYFKQRGITKLVCFPHEYGMSVFGNHGKLYQSEHFIRWYLRFSHWKVSVTSLYYTKSLKRMGAVSENRGYSFMEEEEINEIQYFAILKYNTPIGGVQFHYMNNRKCAYMDFIYLTQEYQGRGWGSEALWQLMLLLKQRGMERIDTDMEEMNAIGQRFLEKCKFGKLGKSYSYERSIEI